jgi:uncharacterized membrane protein YeaQ/YmgE (transglycosylase-associated protein family)
MGTGSHEESASNKNLAWRSPPRGFVIDASERTAMSGIIWIIVVGFVAGIIARMLSPGPNNPSGFILTTVLGIAGAFLATWIGQAIGHYSPDQGAGFITATIGALVVLFIWNRLVARGMISDPGNR